MAGDWIKMREDLFEDPAVLKIAAKLGTRPEHVVGYLHRFWGWVSRNVSPDARDKCPQGSVTGVPILSVESVLNVPGFLGMLVDVGWLEYDPASDLCGGEPLIVIPKFDRHLSESSKKRGIEALKKRNARSRAGEMSLKSRDKCPDIAGTNVPKINGQKSDQRRVEKSREEDRRVEDSRGEEINAEYRVASLPSSSSASPSPDLANAVVRRGDVQSVVDHFQAQHPKSRPGTKERKLIAARLRDGFSVLDLCEAIDGMHRTPHNLGNNDRNTQYLTLSIAMRDASQVTRFIENCRNPPATSKNAVTRAAESAIDAFVRKEQERATLTGVNGND